MSKHSKNNTNSTVFTYMERQKLKAEYGTLHSRLGQDSLRTFKMCTICHNLLIEPTACNQGHMFCRSCAVEFLVKQKKRIAENASEVDKLEKKKEDLKRQELLETEVKRLEQFEKYDNFVQITGREKLATQNPSQKKPEQALIITTQQIKPTGIYELNPKKDQYVKTAFWTLENTPLNIDHVENQPKVVYCPGGKHKLTLKKLRNLKIKQQQKQFHCWICRKEIHHQRVGAYKCGHVVCLACKSDQCEMCEQKEAWLELDNGGSAFAAHRKAEVTTYSHAFLG